MRRGSWRRSPPSALIGAGPPVGWCRSRRAAGVRVQVQAVLHGFRLRHPLEVDARAVTVRINDRAGVVPLFFRDTVPGQPGPPRGYEGYFTDADGYLWEVAWGAFDVNDDGSLRVTWPAESAP
jgi:hypothetical protein